MGRAKNFGTARITLREILGLVACCAVACVSLKFASTAFWVADASVGMLLFMAAAIMAFVDRGPRQAFAIGVVICVVCYGGFVISGGSERELNPYAARLPTSKLMLPIYRAVANDVQVDPFTGGMRAQPNSTTFMSIAHAWWAALFGYVGGRFARWVYARRPTPSEAAPS